jgi:hypothetical protein
MITANAHIAVDDEIHELTRPHFGNENVWVDGRNWVIPWQLTTEPACI